MADDELTDMMYDMEFGELMKDWIEDWSDDENSDRGDRSENGNVLEDLNENNEHDDGEENNSEISNEDYISQLISECHNAYDYYDESDAETGLDVESLAASDSGESQSSVIMSEEEVKCNYLEWVDPEWSVATKFCLRELWSMYDEKLR
ncbi:uncharacterized protein [Aegilops tauschii subsp. strangulata]|uniref:uncharacterized protein n=1 Tax=Aegilops tauschii subsp. strangulata TaxID=200361 RepID=UPI003CC8922E